MQAALTLATDRNQVARSGFPLVGIGSGVERIGAEVVDSCSGLRLNAKFRVIVGGCSVELTASEVAVVHRTVRAPAATAGRQIPAARITACWAVPSVARLAKQGAIATRFYGSRQLVARGGGSSAGMAGSIARHDVDGPAKGLAAKYTRGGAFQDFHTLDVGQVQGKVCRVVSGLWVVDGHAIHEQCDLVEGTAVDTDVRLHSEAAALSDIHADDFFEQVIYTCDTRRRKVFATERCHLTGRQPGGHRDTRRRHHCFLQQGRVGGLLRRLALFRGGGILRPCMQTRCCAHQGGCTQHPDAHLAAQAGKECVALATEMAKRQHISSPVLFLG